MDGDIPQNELASLIYWKSPTDKERVLRWLEKLKEQGYLESHTTHEYNPDMGAPCWYIP